MSDESKDARARRRFRWSLGGMMLVIALVAAPLAWFAYQAREVDRERRMAEASQERAVGLLKQLGMAIQNYEKAQRVQPPPKLPAEASEPPK